MKPTRFGLSFLPDAAPDTRSPKTWFADALSLADLADEAGLAYVKMTEHYLHPYGGYCPSPLAFLAAVAARTRRIRLMTGCLLPVFHHPLQLAAETAMVDAISEGRLDIGFARAYLPYEFDAFGIPLDESRERFQATVETVIRLWTEESVTAQGPGFRFEGATSLPRPVQKPHPPVFVAAVSSPESFGWIGRKGLGLLITTGNASPSYVAEMANLYRDSFQAPVPAPAEGAPARRAPEVVVSMPLYVGETAERATAEADYYLKRYYAVWGSATKAWDHVHSRAYYGYTGLSQRLTQMTPERMRQAGNAIVGSPEQVAEQIQRMQEILRADALIWQIDFGAMPGELSRNSLIRFVERVLPRL